MSKTEGRPATDEWTVSIERHAIALPHATGLLVVDALRPWTALSVQVGEANVLARLQSEGRKNRLDPRVRTEVTYVGEWPAPHQALATIHRLAAHCLPRSLSLRVFFPDDADLLAGLNALVGPTARCTAKFYGNVPELSEDAVAELIGRGTSVIQTAGWPVGNVPDVDRLARLSEIGLRIPTAIYVHNENVAHVLDLAESMLQVTYDAGIALEPVVAHPWFSKSHLHLVPASDDYCQLLVDAFKRFRNCDEVLEPIASLVNNLRWGGWHAALDCGLPMRYLVDATGAARPFRHLPWAEMAGPTAAGGELSLQAACESCRWRRTCSGCETADPRVFELVCAYRMLFLEFFVREMHHGLLTTSGN